MSEGKNKRVKLRCTLRTPVLAGASNGAAAVTIGRARDLSVGGVGLFSQTPLAAGTRLDMTFGLTLSNGVANVRALGEVRHCVFVAAQSRYRIGVRFLEIDAAACRLIELFIAQRSREAA